MGKWKGRQPKKGSTIPAEGGDEMSVDEGGGSKFFACYLLTSMCPRFKGHTYIGFTVNPRRRIRQHNGEVTMGAWRTKRKRPWEMVLCIYGFPTNVSALQFEWAWQHPVESRAVRQAAALFKTLGGVANKIKLAHTMLTLPAWQSLNLTVNFFSTKYKMHSAGCPSLPDHMRVQVCPLDELPCYTGIDMNESINDDWDNSEECERISQELINAGSVESAASNSSAGNQDSTEANVDKHIDWIDELGEHAKEIKTASNSFAGNQDSTEENIDEHIDWIEELDEHAKEDSAPHNNTEQTYIVIDSPVSSLSTSRSFNISDSFKDMYELDGEFGHELPQQPAKVDTYQDPEIKNSLIIKNPGLSREVEVIDLFTPPCYKIADSKKRRLSTACPEIIDLTDSPIFV